MRCAAELDASGPVGDSGRRGDGHTRWHIAWRYGLDSNAAALHRERIVVDLEIHMILPRWDKPSRPNPDLVARWNRYFAALRLHEDGHRHLAEAAAREVRQRLAANQVPGLRPLRKPHWIQGLTRCWRSCASKQADYDRDTDNGKNRGSGCP